MRRASPPYGAGDVAVASTGNITTTGDTSDGINVVSSNGMAASRQLGRHFRHRLRLGRHLRRRLHGQHRDLTSAPSSVAPAAPASCRRSAGANILINWGTITAGLADFAIDSIGDSNLVENFGTITGDVLIDRHRRRQPVHQPRRRAVQHRRRCRCRRWLHRNDGTIAPGGRGIVQTTDARTAASRRAHPALSPSTSTAPNIGSHRRVRLCRSRRQGRRYADQPADDGGAVLPDPAGAGRRHRQRPRRSRPARRCTRR